MPSTTTTTSAAIHMTITTVAALGTPGEEEEERRWQLLDQGGFCVVFKATLFCKASDTCWVFILLFPNVVVCLRLLSIWYTMPCRKSKGDSLPDWWICWLCFNARVMKGKRRWGRVWECRSSLAASLRQLTLVKFNYSFGLLCSK